MKLIRAGRPLFPKSLVEINSEVQQLTEKFCVHIYKIENGKEENSIGRETANYRTREC